LEAKAMILRPRITKEKLEALIKAVEEGGDDDDEITEDEAIAILVCAENSNSDIMVMQSAKDRVGMDTIA
jgi:hypothetical protein